MVTNTSNAESLSGPRKNSSRTILCARSANSIIKYARNVHDIAFLILYAPDFSCAAAAFRTATFSTFVPPYDSTKREKWQTTRFRRQQITLAHKVGKRDLCASPALSLRRAADIFGTQSRKIGFCVPGRRRLSAGQQLTLAHKAEKSRFVCQPGAVSRPGAS